MNRVFSSIASKPFIQNVFVMVTGTAATQLVTFVLSPIITRLYGAEALGILSVFLAMAGIIAPIAALTFPVSIVLPKSDYEAKGLVKLSIYITICISIIIGLVLLFFHQDIVRIFHIELIAPFLYLVPILILSSGSLQVVDQWLIRTKQYKVTAKITFFQNLFFQSSKIGLGYLYPIAPILIILTAFNEGVKAIMLISLARRSREKHYISEVEKKLTIKDLMIRYKDFPIYRAPEVLIDAIASSLPLLMLANYFGPASAGYYSIAGAVLNVPSALIGKSIGDVLYPKLTESANNNMNIASLVLKATLVLCGLGIIPFGLLIIFGPSLFSLVFGVEWVKAGEFARWMSIGIFFMFINIPSVKVLPVISAQAFHLRFTIVSLFTRFIALAVGFYLFSDDLIAIALFGVSGALLNILFISLSLKASRVFDAKQVNDQGY